MNYSQDLPLISIVTVVYNDFAHIEETILSVFNQTYPHIEYIIIDGSSTDGTVDIIKKYEDKISYWISEKDKGIYDAMNKGIKIATGEWINFMNSGDMFYDINIVETVVNSIDREIALLYGMAENRYMGFSKIRDNFPLSKMSKKMPFSHQSMFVKTKLHKTNFYDLSYTICADYDFICKIYIANNYFKEINQILVTCDTGGFSARYSHKMLKETSLIAYQYFPSISIKCYYWKERYKNYLKAFIKYFLPKKVLLFIQKF